MNWERAGTLLTAFLGWLFSYLQRKSAADDADRSEKHLQREATSDKILDEINSPRMAPDRVDELLSNFDPSQAPTVPPKTEP